MSHADDPFSDPHGLLLGRPELKSGAFGRAAQVNAECPSAAAAGESAGRAESDLLALQPGALFLLDDSGVVRQVGGAWRAVTGLDPADVLGSALSRWVRLPATLFPEGFLTREGQCAEALVAGTGGVRRARAVWRREGRQIAGHLEALASPARATFDASEREHELYAALDELIACLGISLDSSQGRHVERMTGFAVRLAEAAALTPLETRWVRWGAGLHDVGKSRVPPEILWKQGALTAQEFEVMLHHPAWGLQVIESVAFLPQAVRDAVLHHHERYDGMGYPMGLDSERIPLVARVIAIADVFDALTSPRSYKPAWSHQQATEYLIKNSGSQFDPYLVRVFVLDVLGFEHLRDLLDNRQD